MPISLNLYMMTILEYLIINHSNGELLFIKLFFQHIFCFHYRHWAAIPSDTHGRPALMPRIQSPDGTYLASEFNYTLSRQRKGYDTVGYKHYIQKDNAQSDPRFKTIVRADRETDTGYYSDRMYESPICLASKERDIGDEPCLDTNSDRNISCFVKTHS